MTDDDLDPSLSDRVRSLPLAPDFKDVLLELTERVEQATAVEEVLRRAGGAPYRTRPSPKRKRDRHGLHGIKGGLAAFAPLAPLPFLFHDGLAAGAATVLRLAGRSKHAQTAAVVAALSVGAALLMPTPGAIDTPAGAAQVPGGAVVDHDQHQRPGLREQAPGRKRRHGDADADTVEAHRDREARGMRHDGAPPWAHGPAGARRTSSVRNPGPRRDEGSTVTWKHAPTRARRVARGRPSNCSRVMPVCVPRSRAWASPAASCRSSPRRWSIDSRRRRSNGRWPPLAWSDIARSVSAR